MTLAGRLVRAAAALLPPDLRERYRAEFASELADLPPREHLGYALRLWATLPRLTWTLGARPPAAATATVVVVALVAAGLVGWQVVRGAILRTPFTITDAAGAAPAIAWTAGTDARLTEDDKPTFVEATRSLVLIQDGEATRAFDPRTGIELWSQRSQGLRVSEGAREVAPDRLGLWDGTVLDARTGEVVRRAPGLSDAALRSWTPFGLVTTEVLHNSSCSPVRVALAHPDGSAAWSTTVAVPEAGLPDRYPPDGPHLFMGASLIGTSDLTEVGLFGAVLDADTGAVVQPAPCLERRSTAFAPVGDQILRLDETWDRAEASTTLLDASGRTLWSVDGPAVAASGMVFAHTRAESDQRLTTQRLSAGTGQPAWPQPIDGGRVRVVGDTVVVLDQLHQPTGRLTFVDADTGAIRAAHTLPFQIADAISDGTTLYAWARLDFDDGLPKALPLVAFDVATGAETWRATFSRGTDVRLVGGTVVLVDDIAGQAHGLAPGRR